MSNFPQALDRSRSALSSIPGWWRRLVAWIDLGDMFRVNTYQPGLSGGSDSDFDAIEMISYLWGQRRPIAVVVGVFLLFAILYLHSARYLYTAELTVSPVDSFSQTGGSRLGGLSGLASIAGVSLPEDPVAMRFAMYKESVFSTDVALAMSRRTDLMRVAFGNEWSPRQERFVEPGGAVHAIASVVKWILGVPSYPWHAPDAAQMRNYIEDNVRVLQNPKTPVLVLVFKNQNPRFAADFLWALHNAADAVLREKMLIRSTKDIAFLTDQLSKATIEETRAALASALTEQIKLQMMSSSNLPYAAEPFGQPADSLRPTSPRPILVLFGAIFLGFVVGSFTALLLRHLAYRRARTDLATAADDHRSHP